MDERVRVIAAARAHRWLVRGFASFSLLAVVWLACLFLAFATLGSGWTLPDWMFLLTFVGTLVGAMLMVVLCVRLMATLYSKAAVERGSVAFVVVSIVGVWVLWTQHGGSSLIMIAGIATPLAFMGSAIVGASGTKHLRLAGVRVGFLGVREEELRRLSSGVCFHCGYLTAGLPTAVCPECGKESRIGA